MLVRGPGCLLFNQLTVTGILEELTVPYSIIYLFIILYDVLFYGFAEMFYLKESCEITHLIFAPV